MFRAEWIATTGTFVTHSHINAHSGFSFSHLSNWFVRCIRLALEKWINKNHKNHTSTWTTNSLQKSFSFALNWISVTSFTDSFRHISVSSFNDSFRRWLSWGISFHSFSKMAKCAYFFSSNPLVRFTRQQTQHHTYTQIREYANYFRSASTSFFLRWMGSLSLSHCFSVGFFYSKILLLFTYRKFINIFTFILEILTATADRTSGDEKNMFRSFCFSFGRPSRAKVSFARN